MSSETSTMFREMIRGIVREILREELASLMGGDGTSASVPTGRTRSIETLSPSERKIQMRKGALKFLARQSEPVKSRAIADAIGAEFTASDYQSLIRKLFEEELIERHGERQFAMYTITDTGKEVLG